MGGCRSAIAATRPDLLYGTMRDVAVAVSVLFYDHTAIPAGVAAVRF